MYGQLSANFWPCSVCKAKCRTLHITHSITALIYIKKIIIKIHSNKQYCKPFTSRLLLDNSTSKTVRLWPGTKLRLTYLHSMGRALCPETTEHISRKVRGQEGVYRRPPSKRCYTKRRIAWLACFQPSVIYEN